MAWSITPQQFREAFTAAAAGSDPVQVAKAERLIADAAADLDPSDQSARAQILRGITEDATTRDQPPAN